MAEQAEFLENIRAAVDHLFTHRKTLRHVAVRFAFWPDGLAISAHFIPDPDAYPSASERRENNEGRRLEVIPWDALATIDRAGLIAIVDRVCQPSYDLIMARGAAIRAVSVRAPGHLRLVVNGDGE